MKKKPAAAKAKSKARSGKSNWKAWKTQKKEKKEKKKQEAKAEAPVFREIGVQTEGHIVVTTEVTQAGGRAGQVSDPSKEARGHAPRTAAEYMSGAPENGAAAANPPCVSRQVLSRPREHRCTASDDPIVHRTSRLWAECGSVFHRARSTGQKSECGACGACWIHEEWSDLCRSVCP